MESQIGIIKWIIPLHWRHNERDRFSNHLRLDCFLNRLFRRKSKKTSNLREGSHMWTVDSPHKGSVTRKMYPFDDVIMFFLSWKSPRQNWYLRYLISISTYTCFVDVHSWGSPEVDIDTLFPRTLILVRRVPMLERYPIITERVYTCIVWNCSVKYLYSFNNPDTYHNVISVISAHFLDA